MSTPEERLARKLQDEMNSSDREKNAYQAHKIFDNYQNQTQSRGYLPFGFGFGFGTHPVIQAVPVPVPVHVQVNMAPGINIQFYQQTHLGLNVVRDQNGNIRII